jgi:hypothetical protein
LVSYLIFNYNFLDIVRCVNTIQDVKPTNEGLYETSVLYSNYDEIAIKLGIISIYPVTLSCYTSPTSSLISRDDDGKHLTTCVGQKLKNLPSGQSISNI